MIDNDSSPLTALCRKDGKRPCLPRFSRSITEGAIGSSNTTTISHRELDFLPHMCRNGSIDSPTMSLAADLSQNFHIEKTPTIPTPRRSLFQNPEEHQKSKLDIEDENRNSSSPSTNGSFASSPLTSTTAPLRRMQSSFAVPQIPARSSARSKSYSQLKPRSANFLNCLSKPSPPTSRPCLTGSNWPDLENKENVVRSKVYQPENLVPEVSMDESADAITLDGLFNASPAPPRRSLARTVSDRSPEDLAVTPSRFRAAARRPIKSASFGPSFDPSCNSTSDGFSETPLAGVCHRASKFRRTHSMFQRSIEVLAEERSSEVCGPPSGRMPSSFLCPAPSIYSFNESSEDLNRESECAERLSTAPLPDIPFIQVKSSDPFKRIRPHTLTEILDGNYAEYFSRVIVVDCRFEYEFNGGHIEGAINCNTKESIEEYLFKGDPARDGKACLVFHCEYSAHRAPRMAWFLRKRDREENIQNYPTLYYPHIFILEGGYSRFFDAHRDRCYPQRYVEMNDSAHKNTCERELNRFRQTLGKGMDRAITFSGFSSKPFKSISSSIKADQETSPMPPFLSQSYRDREASSASTSTISTTGYTGANEANTPALTSASSVASSRQPSLLDIYNNDAPSGFSPPVTSESAASFWGKPSEAY